MAPGRNFWTASLPAACGMAMLLLFGSPAARADQYAVGVVFVGQPDEVRTDATTCRFAGGCYTASYTVANGSTTPTVLFYEYNTGTCAPISPGEWRDEGKSDPKHGTDTQQVVSYTDTSGDSCTGVTYQASQVFYTASAATTPVADRFAAVWSTKDYKTGVCPTCNIGVTITVKIFK
jgi:hypothetical protein